MWYGDTPRAAYSSVPDAPGEARPPCPSSRSGRAVPRPARAKFARPAWEPGLVRSRWSVLGHQPTRARALRRAPPRRHWLRRSRGARLFWKTDVRKAGGISASARRVCPGTSGDASAHLRALAAATAATHAPEVRQAPSSHGASQTDRRSPPSLPQSDSPSVSRSAGLSLRRPSSSWMRPSET